MRLPFINPLLKTGRVDFTGPFYEARDCEILPRGPRPNGSPLMVAAFGPKMVSFAAAHADIWATSANSPADLDVPPRATPKDNTLSASVEEIAAQLAAFRDAGLGNLVLKVNPYAGDGTARLAKAVEAFRAL